MVTWKVLTLVGDALDNAVDGTCPSPPMKEISRSLQPAFGLIVRLMQMGRRGVELREIEAALKRNDVPIGCCVLSIHQSLQLGRHPLPDARGGYAWLLASASLAFLVVGHQQHRGAPATHDEENDRVPADSPN